MIPIINLFMTVHEETLELTEKSTDKRKNMKILLTGKKSDQEIFSKFSNPLFETEYFSMEKPLKNPDSNFTFSNLKPSIDYAQQNGHDLIIALDHEWNKLGIVARKTPKGPFQIITVHQLAALLSKLWIENNENESLVFIKSIHISDMVEKIALRHNKKIENLIIENETLAEKVGSTSSANEGVQVLGFTENQDFIDNQNNLTDIVEKIILWEHELNSREQTLFDAVLNLYQDYGFYKEKTFIVDLNEASQVNHVRHQMDTIRKNQPVVKERLNIDRIIDFKKGTSTNFLTNKKLSLNHPSIDILQVVLDDGTSVSFVPEKHKMSYYISMTGRFISKDNYLELNKSFDDQILRLMQTLNKL